MSSNLEPLIPARPATRTALVILTGFTAALCWWIAIAGVANSAAGIIFLAIPVLATIATLRAARRRPPPHKAQHVNQLQRHRARGALSAHRRSAVVLCGFTAVLCWWIAIVAVVNIAAGTVVLTVPVLATIGTVLAARYKGRAQARV
ncbi:hypothetical protein [Arthrobacter sp. MMS18-M83]|uniref:hypothetical protein n=1 Tax=Arthrobacter sp. MMS18-M83 TaxID=2996261 RepID=UPI00227B591C|nr:hypothetical protein [Arthrobacter sp. MMS18-M83]WAH99108.1 hypothetical protein OW521_09925 [Arthrobacter sp. MMS18-M83]